MYWAINLGFAIAPVLAGAMARLDYFLLFAGDAATTFAFGLIVLAGVRETRPLEAHTASKSPLWRRLRQLGASPLMLLFCALALAFGMIYMQAHVALPVDMAAHGLGPEAYGLAIAVNGMLIVLLGLPASHAAVRWPRFGAMAVAAALTGAGFGLTGLAGSLPLFALSIGVWTMGEIAGSTVAPAIVADLSPVARRADCSRAPTARPGGCRPSPARSWAVRYINSSGPGCCGSAVLGSGCCWLAATWPSAPRLTSGLSRLQSKAGPVPAVKLRG